MKTRSTRGPEVEEDTEVSAQSAVESSWLVIVHNDPVNLMSYVVLVFKQVFGYNEEKATKHMLEVHEQGASVLWRGSRERAESYVHQLQEWQLRATMEKDD